MTAACYLDDGDDEVAEYDGNRNVVAFYVRGPAIDEPIVRSAPKGDGTYTHSVKSLAPHPAIGMTNPESPDDGPLNWRPDSTLLRAS